MKALAYKKYKYLRSLGLDARTAGMIALWFVRSLNAPTHHAGVYIDAQLRAMPKN